MFLASTAGYTELIHKLGGKAMDGLYAAMAAQVPYLDDPSLLRSIVADGCDRARAAAQETMREVRAAMGLVYD